MKKLSLKSRFNDSPVALHRLEVIEFYLKYGTQPTIDAFKISKRSLFRWKHMYISSHKDPNVLIPLSTRPTKLRNMQVSIEVIQEIRRIRYLYGCIGKRKIKVLLDEYCKENGYPCISISTVGKVIKRYNMISLNKRIYHNPNTKRIHRYTVTKVKYTPKSSTQGYVEVDTILRFVNGMRLYVFNAVDIHTKFEFAYGYTSNTTRSSVDFLNKLLSVYPIKDGIHTIQTDNGSEYLGKFHEQVLRKGLEHKYIYPRCPRINGCVERSNRVLQECFVYHNEDVAYALGIQEFNKRLMDYLVWFNTKRPHESLGDISPINYVLKYHPECHMYATCTNSFNKNQIWYTVTMLNLPLFKKSDVLSLSKDENIVALDIGTELLKSVLFSVNEFGVEIKKISRIEQQQHAMRSGIITNLDTVLENCRLSISSTTQRLTPDQMPRNVVMGIAGEYIQGVSIVVNYQREENFEKEVTEKEQKKILTQIEQKIGTSGKEDLSQRIGLTNDDIEILHITKTGLEIGGMPVDSLVGYKGRDIKLNYYASFAPRTYVESLRKVASDLKMNVIGIVAQPFAVARAYSGSSNRDFSAIFIDIGGGTTDIAIVEKGSVVETKMFAFGGRTFTKELAKVLNIDYRFAEQRKLKYSKKELNRELSREVQTIVYPVAKLWLKTLKSALDYCDDIDTFPTQIFLCGGGALLPEIREVMIEFPWKKFSRFPVVPKIDFFTPEKLENITDTSGELKHVFDITPASLAKFVYDINKKKSNGG